ncbi:MAG: hypothetical protein A3E79_14780 [Burkholderiales bacterium RIFCSPHIGHO2_12_FULL_61_11]|nr:MAG: hypothetical protein A3E79_14780 [Burkholderiales bacterium RIFCSPHIGHO2_12_FULL_61_11]
MKKVLIANAAVGGLMFVVGASIHDFLGIRELGNVLAYGGIWYGALSLAIFAALPLYKKLRPRIDDAFDERSSSRAYEDLLRWKKLLDENIISQDEFDVKSRELKAKLL